MEFLYLIALQRCVMLKDFFYDILIKVPLSILRPQESPWGLWSTCGMSSYHRRWLNFKRFGAIDRAVHLESYCAGTVLFLGLIILESEAWCLPRLLEFCERRCTLQLRPAKMAQPWKNGAQNRTSVRLLSTQKWKVLFLLLDFKRKCF